MASECGLRETPLACDGASYAAAGRIRALAIFALENFFTLMQTSQLIYKFNILLKQSGMLFKKYLNYIFIKTSLNL